MPNPPKKWSFPNMAREYYGWDVRRLTRLTTERSLKQISKVRISPDIEVVTIPALRATKGERAIRAPFLIAG